LVTSPASLRETAVNTSNARFVREAALNASDVREGMEVAGSCGGRVGFVDGVEMASIKLTTDSEGARGECRYVPMAWVAWVRRHVQLSRPCRDVREEWTAHPTGEAGA
jgi:hypothetical protein